MIKFFWNGIKDNGGKLQRCWYSNTPLRNYPTDTLTIYARDWTRFSAGIQEAFAFLVQNDTDIMTDYFDQDTIRVTPDNPMYAQVKAAYDAQEAHHAMQARKREAKYQRSISTRPGDEAAIFAEETGISYSRSLIMNNMD